jgi:fucose 4-O-acetylase-like acetyltransferase
VTPASAPARHDWVDVAKGLGIILVVFGHVWRGLHAAGLPIGEARFALIDSLVYSVHMPLFFCLSGLFFHDSLLKRGSLGLMASKVDSLVWPYLVWSLLQGGVEVALSHWTNGKTSPGQVLALWEPRAQFWFLYALFLSCALGCLFYARLRRGEAAWMLPSALLLYAIAGNLTDPSVIDQTMTYFAYFALGAALRPLEAMLQRHVALLLAPALLAVGVGEWLFHARLGLDYRSIGVAAFALATVGVLALLLLSLGLSRALPRLATGLQALGAASMPIYLMHILAGSGTRILLARVLHLDSVALQALIGTLAGLLLPMGAHALLRRAGLGALFAPPRWASAQAAWERRRAPGSPLRAA